MAHVSFLNVIQCTYDLPGVRTSQVPRYWTTEWSYVWFLLAAGNKLDKSDIQTPFFFNLLKAGRYDEDQMVLKRFSWPFPFFCAYLFGISSWLERSKSPSLPEICGVLPTTPQWGVLAKWVTRSPLVPWDLGRMLLSAAVKGFGYLSKQSPGGFATDVLFLNHVGSWKKMLWLFAISCFVSYYDHN